MLLVSQWTSGFKAYSDRAIFAITQTHLAARFLLSQSTHTRGLRMALCFNLCLNRVCMSAAAFFYLFIYFSHLFGAGPADAVVGARLDEVANQSARAHLGNLFRLPAHHPLAQGVVGEGRGVDDLDGGGVQVLAHPGPLHRVLHDVQPHLHRACKQQYFVCVYIFAIGYKTHTSMPKGGHSVIHIYQARIN